MPPSTSILFNMRQVTCRTREYHRTFLAVYRLDPVFSHCAGCLSDRSISGLKRSPEPPQPSAGTRPTVSRVPVASA